MKKRFLKTYVFQKYSNSSFGHFFNYKIVHNKVLHSASIPPVDSPKGSRFEMTLKTKFKIFRYDLENFTINPQLFYPSEHKLMNIRLPCVIPKGFTAWRDFCGSKKILNVDLTFFSTFVTTARTTLRILAYLFLQIGSFF